MPETTVLPRVDAPNLCPGSGVQYPRSAGRVRQCPFCGAEVEFIGGQVLRHERDERPLWEIVQRHQDQLAEIEAELAMLRAMHARLDAELKGLKR